MNELIEFREAPPPRGYAYNRKLRRRKRRIKAALKAAFLFISYAAISTAMYYI